MPSSSSTSFIPKRSPDKSERRKSPRPVYFGTVIVRVLFFIVLLAAAGIFVYKHTLNKELNAHILAFKVETERFTADQEKLNVVTSMDERLTQASYLLNASVSLTTLLDSIEKSTISTIKFDSLSIEQELDSEVKVTATIKTDSFDSTIFQRSILSSNDLLSNATLADVSVETSRSTDEKTGEVDEPISFAVNIVLDAKTIPLGVEKDSMIVPVKDTTVPTSDSATSSQVNESGSQETDVEIMSDVNI